MLTCQQLFLLNNVRYNMAIQINHFNVFPQYIFRYISNQKANNGFNKFQIPTDITKISFNSY